jgi:hypothetical protein
MQPPPAANSRNPQEQQAYAAGYAAAAEGFPRPPVSWRCVASLPHIRALEDAWDRGYAAALRERKRRMRE